MTQMFRKTWEWTKRNWKSILSVTGIVALLTVGFAILSNVLSRDDENERENGWNPNTRPDGREQDVGEVDDEGFAQVPVLGVEGESIEVDERPEGVDDVTERVEVRPTTNAGETETHSESFFDRRRREREGEQKYDDDRNGPLEFVDHPDD